MSCGDFVSLDIIKIAGATSTLAGVLAGFLISSVAVLFATVRRVNVYALGLFSSGVFVLTISSYIFGATTGFMAERFSPLEHPCGQLWSQELAAFGLLLVAVAVCGCG